MDRMRRDEVLRRMPADLVKTRQPGNARYIEHAQVRQRLIDLQADGHLRFDWLVLSCDEHPDGWLVHGRLMVGWPATVGGRVEWHTQTHDVLGDMADTPAAAESRAFTRVAAFATGVGLQAWTGEAGYWLDLPKHGNAGS
jgi:hypothetical protein